MGISIGSKFGLNTHVEIIFFSIAGQCFVRSPSAAMAEILRSEALRQPRLRHHLR